MEVRNFLIEEPFFSVCIPRYNRTSFLMEVCKSLMMQAFKNFEVCISDNCSTDGREEELLSFLKQSGLSFIYHKNERNLKLDGNMRASFDVARGKYCFLLCSDDCLASPDSLGEVHAAIQSFGPVGVVITNYEDFFSGRKFQRIRKTGILGHGPEVVVRNFRKFSFGSGVLLNTRKAKEHATAKWDGSEYYHLFIGCRIVAEGAPLLGIDRVIVRQGIQIAGEQVESYASKPRLKHCPVVERKLPFNMFGRLVADAIGPYTQPLKSKKFYENIFFQIFVFPYLYWIIEYRRVQSWRYALGICIGMRPRNVLEGLHLSWWRSTRLFTLYGLITFLGLIFPIKLFKALEPQLYSMAKAF